jgi:hypothetical protein
LMIVFTVFPRCTAVLILGECSKLKRNHLRFIIYEHFTTYPRIFSNHENISSLFLTQKDEKEEFFTQRRNQKQSDILFS